MNVHNVVHAAWLAALLCLAARSHASLASHEMTMQALKTRRHLSVLPGPGDRPGESSGMSSRGLSAQCLEVQSPPAATPDCGQLAACSVE